MSERSNWSGQPWMWITTNDLETERLQAVAEGRDWAALADEYDELVASDLNDPAAQARAEAWFDRVQATARDPRAVAAEPSDWAAIAAARPVAESVPAWRGGEDELHERLLGAWLGRCSGCLVGKPVEGRRSHHIRQYLEAQGRWPLRGYFSREADEDLARECNFNLGWRGVYLEDIHGMVEDDDTNYTVLALDIVDRHGADFGPHDIATAWLRTLPLYHVCTAERIAYRNLAAGLAPPASASFRNPYREWIGAQIRADFYGYVNPAQPARAAEWAWRDAAVSHIANGLYGAMWVAAMHAAAFVLAEPAAIIAAGLAQVPAASRLTQRVRGILDLYAGGASWEDAIASTTAEWDEGRGYDWCHTISNAELVAAALLWGELDPLRSIGYAVMPGFDTDCNGATVGSIVGLRLGAQAWPAELTDPLADRLETGVHGYHQVAISDLAQRSVALANRL